MPPPIQPYWQRLPQVLTFPLRGEPLMVLLLLSIGQLIGYLPILGLIVAIFLVLFAYKYAVTILRHTADGYPGGPDGAVPASDGLMFKLVILAIVFKLLAQAVALHLSLGWIIATWAAIALIQPGATMILAMEQSFAAALTPTRWLELMQRLGFAYGLVALLLLAIESVALFAGGALAGLLPPIMAQIVATFAAYWGLFATYYLMGYLIYQYQDALGFVPLASAQALELPRDADQVLLDAAQSAEKAHGVEAACALLAEAIAVRGVSAAVHAAYRKLLQQTGDGRAVSAHAQIYLQVLLLQRDERQALALAHESLNADPHFTPLEPAGGLALARAALRLGQRGFSRAMARATRRAHPKTEEGIEAVLIEVELLQSEPKGVPLARAALLEVRARHKASAGQARLDQALAKLD